MNFEFNRANRMIGKTAMGLDIKETGEFSHFIYYRRINGGDRPDTGIRVLIDKQGRTRGAETMNPETGHFRKSTGLLSEIRKGDWIEDSTEEEFDRLNAERMEWTRRRKLAKSSEPS